MARRGGGGAFRTSCVVGGPSTIIHTHTPNTSLRGDRFLVLWVMDAVQQCRGVCVSSFYWARANGGVQKSKRDNAAKQNDKGKGKKRKLSETFSDGSDSFSSSDSLSSDPSSSDLEEEKKFKEQFAEQLLERNP